MVPVNKFFFQILLCAAITIFSSGVLSAAEYQTLQQFLAHSPEQVVLTEKFTGVVSEKGRSIEAGIQKSPVRISFICPGNQVSDYWRRSIASLTMRMDEIGLRYEITQYLSQTGDIRTQEGQLRKALTTDPDYLVYTLDVNRHKRLIERMISKKRPKIILQNITTPLKEWHNRQPFMYVGFDHATGTRMLAEQLESRLGSGIDYGVLFHSQGYVSDMRGKTFIHRMSGKNNWNLKASYYTEGKREKARQATLEILTDPKIKMIYACSTDAAFGAVDGVSETGRSGSITINGWGGGGKELHAIQDGMLDLTVMRINDDNGVAMAEAIRLDVEGKTAQVPLVFSGKFEVVEKGITKERLQALKERSFRYSGLELE